MQNHIKIAFLILGTMLFMLPGVTYAQQKTLVRGTISDHQNEPLPFVTVMEMDKQNRIVSSVASDIDGNFSINMLDPSLNGLVFRYVGYKDKTVRVGGNRVLKVILDDSSLQLDDVVVTAKAKQNLGGLGIDQRDLSMAIGHIDASEISEVHAASIDDALQGRIAGVDIVGSSGNPGGGMTIRIRGLSSINGTNNPLIVVDGIPMETTIGANSSSSFDYSSATEEEFSQLLNIAPSDIQEISVLKDAAASAIYGSRGADGVILITTKRGSISAPQVNFRSSFTTSTQPSALKRLSGLEYTTLITQAMYNAGTILDTSVYPEFAYDPSNTQYYYNYSQDTDWVDALIQTGIAQEYNLSLAGGSRKVRYRLSAGYWDEKGITIETGLQRINTRSNLDYFVSDKLRLSADVSFTHSENQRNFIPESSDNTSGDLRDKAYIKMPNQSIYAYTVSGEKTSLYFTPESNLQGTYPAVYNPVAMAKDGKNNVTSDNARPKFSLIYDYNSQWQYSFDVAFEITDNKTEKYLPQTATGLAWNNSSTNYASDKDDDSFVIQTYAKARWMPAFNNRDKHSLVALVGLNTYDRKSNTNFAATTNLPSYILQDPAIPSRTNPGGSISSSFAQQRNLSAYMNVNYKLWDRYVVYASLRLDGDSRFGDEYKYGLFPALSGRYRLSDEKFLKKHKWLDDLSIRASWGLNGTTPKYDYMYYSKYGNYSYNYLGSTATYPSSIALDNLHWEKSVQKDVAMNLTAFDSRLNVEFDYYLKRTKDGISNTTIPSISGFSSATLNLNTVENVGWELNVRTTPLKKKDWQLDFNFNIAKSENFLRKVSKYAVTESGSWQNNGEYLVRLEVNQPYGSFYGYKYNGVYLNKQQTEAKDATGNTIYTIGATGDLEPVYMKFGYPSIGYDFQPGDARYVDINHDGNINLQDVVYLGDYNPLFFGGFGAKLKYKNFTLDSYFYYRYGNDIINMTRMNMEKMYNFDNQSKATLHRFKKEYPVGTESTAPSDLLPRPLFKSGYNWLASDRFVEDGSFVRLKTLTLKYNVPRKQSRRMGLTDLYLWMTAQNIWTLTNYTGQDPEVSISGSLSTVGRDYSQAPRPKQLTFGLNVTF